VPNTGLGSDLWSQEFDSSIHPTGSTLVEFTGVGLAVTQGTEYAIVIRPVQMSGSPNNYDLRWHTASGTGYAGAPYYSIGADTSSWTVEADGKDQTFHITSEAEPEPSTPELLTPTDGAINQSINSDHFKQFTYDDEDSLAYSEYTVYFSIDGGSTFIPQNDRSRYSILSYMYTLDITLEYNTTYYWFVRKVVDDEDWDSDTWSFTTMEFSPPLPTGITLDANGNPIGTALGLNNMITIRRLVAVADNKVYYET
jgi:hypothetical protein